jgi:hypothetical protein
LSAWSLSSVRGSGRSKRARLRLRLSLSGGSLSLPQHLVHVVLPQAFAMLLMPAEKQALFQRRPLYLRRDRVDLVGDVLHAPDVLGEEPAAERRIA